MSKIPKNKLTKPQWRIVVMLKNGSTLHQEIDDEGRRYYFGHGGRRPSIVTVHNLIKGGWLKPVNDGLFSDSQTLILS